jgi:hypothetical protein
MSGFETVKFEINGRTYKTTVLDAYANRGLYLRIVKSITPALEKYEGLKTEAGWAKLVGAVLAGLDVGLFEDLCDVFGSATVVVEAKAEVQLSPAVMGQHFAKRYSSMLTFVYKCCQANGFLDFLSAIAVPESDPVPASK